MTTPTRQRARSPGVTVHDSFILDGWHVARRRSVPVTSVARESPMEQRLVRWIVRAGLPRPVPQHRVRANGAQYRLDLAYPELLIGIEYDGWAAHAPRSSFDRDRARRNPLEIRGWLVLRYTSAATRALVVTEVRDALTARSSHLEASM